MKKLSIIYSENKIEIKNWERFSIIELSEMLESLTAFLRNRLQFQFCQGELDDKFKEYEIKPTLINGRLIKEWKSRT